MLEAKSHAWLLRPFAISMDGRVVDRWERPTARRLLQLLLLNGGRHLTRDSIADALFRSLDGAAGSNAVAKAISMARSATDKGLIESTRDYVRLGRPVTTDFHNLLHRLEAGLTAPVGERVERLRSALEIDGRLLPEESYADWAEAHRVRLAELRGRARQELARRLTAETRREEALQAWEAVAREDPANEEAALSVIAVHGAEGNRRAASAAYERCRVALLEETGQLPSAKLEAAYWKVAFPGASEDADANRWLRAGRERLVAREWKLAQAAFGQALVLAADTGTRVGAWLGLASIPYQHGDMVAVSDICRMALDDVPPDHRAQLLAELGWAQVRAGRPTEGRPNLEQARLLLRQGKGADGAVKARVLDRLALARSDCGDHRGGLKAMDEAFACLPSNLPNLTAVLRMHRGRLLARVGHPAEGLGEIHAARRAFEALGDQYSTSVAYWLAAEVLDQMGLLEHALAEREKEAELLSGIDNPRNLAGALIHRSSLMDRLGRRREAAEAAGRALETALQTGDPRLIAWAREGFGKSRRAGSSHAKR
ncbi:MAG TPA: BTAD domain-containing putative transcriptional regulator [Candidatus Dormibacteraeota bacterium]